MSEIKVKRIEKTDKSTIGEMYFPEDKLFCWVLEDVVREPGVKVYGKTAIPPGRYQLIIDFSNRFKRMMPHILNVPNFEGVRIHPGNTPEDTEGCLLLGMTKSKDFVGRSKDAFNRFFPKLEAILIHEKVFITIESFYNHRVKKMTPIFCPSCDGDIICDFCKYFSFNPDNDRRKSYTGDGFCNLKKEKKDLWDGCDSFICFNIKD